MFHATIAPRTSVMEALQSVGRDANYALTEVPTGEQERSIGPIAIAPEHRELSEIVWYPHTAAWRLLQQGAPLLFCPPLGHSAGLLAIDKPLVVVPLDGHVLDERAIPPACALAESVNGEVVLVHVVRCSMSERARREMDTAQRGWWLKRMREARRYLRAVRARTAAQTSASVSTKLLLGDPGTTLVAFAHRRWVGAIVMTTHNEMRNERFFAGAVATQVVRQAPAPTLLIPLGAETETPGRITRAAAIAATP